MLSPVVIKPSLAYDQSSIKTASYEDFLYVKAKYQENLERVKTIPPISRNGILIIIGCIVIFILFSLYFNLSKWWIFLIIFGPVFHIKLETSLIELANTNYFYYKLFQNPTIAALFNILRDNDGVVTGMRGISFGFILIYSCIGLLVYYFLMYNDKPDIRGASRFPQLPTNPNEPY